MASVCREILSIRNPAIKDLYRLRVGRRRAREKQGLVLVRGRQLIAHLGEYFKFDCVFTHEGGDTFKQYNAGEVVRVDKAVLKHVLFSQTWQAFKKSQRLDDDEYVVGTIARPQASDFSAQAPPQRLLALDSVKHPENMGLLLSTAVALRFDGVFLTGKCIDPFSHKVLEASQAVAWTLPYRFGTPEELLQICKEHRLVPCAAAAEGSGGAGGEAWSSSMPVAQLQELDGRKHDGFCLAVGNEARGVCPELLRKCRRVSLPMSELVESLNAGVAGGILMHALACAWG